ncbi:MAG: bifunctional 4-hydroxy-2-oxoglutarate aldolase/2-dehydro-3-deoxy-phosphogluconate aldolase, partial [Acidobacteriota bacterium]
MSRKEQIFASVRHHVIIGVVREDDAENARMVARTYAEQGIANLEITLTTPDAFQIIEWLATEYEGKSITIAAGSVRTVNDAASARRAGAQIIVSPHTAIPVIEYAKEHDLFCVAGALSVTEIVTAWEAGADVIKVYPVGLVGGPDYIRTVRQPIRDIPMLAGGPVAIEQIDSYLDAGAVAVNLGGSLAVPEAVRARNWKEIARRVSLAT